MSGPVKLYKIMHKAERTTGSLGYSCNPECLAACIRTGMPATGKEPHSTMYDRGW